MVDPGSYVYTPDPDARNQFRGTAFHNTVGVDGTEQNELRPEWLFRLFETATPSILPSRNAEMSWCIADAIVVLEAVRPVVHERTFTLSKSDGALTIVDVLHGQGTHRLRWHFHFAPGLEVALGAGGAVEITSGRRVLRMAVPNRLRPTLGTAWCSPSYGVRLPCRCLDLEIEAPAEPQTEYVFSVS